MTLVLMTLFPLISDYSPFVTLVCLQFLLTLLHVPYGAICGFILWYLTIKIVAKLHIVSPLPGDQKFTGGKFMGKTFSEIHRDHPEYSTWIRHNLHRCRKPCYAQFLDYVESEKND